MDKSDCWDSVKNAVFLGIWEHVIFYSKTCLRIHLFIYLNGNLCILRNTNDGDKTGQMAKQGLDNFSLLDSFLSLLGVSRVLMRFHYFHSFPHSIHEIRCFRNVKMQITKNKRHCQFPRELHFTYDYSQQTNKTGSALYGKKQF